MRKEVKEQDPEMQKDKTRTSVTGSQDTKLKTRSNTKPAALFPLTLFRAAVTQNKETKRTTKLP